MTWSTTIVGASDKPPGLSLGRLLGVPVRATPDAYWHIPLSFGAGLLLALVQPGLTGRARLMACLHFGLAGLLSNLLHASGHIVGGHIVGAPMDELLITPTRWINRYQGDQSGYSSAVHLGRASGGPIANILTALVLIALSRRLPAPPGRTGGERLLWSNLIFGLGSLAPVPSVDGEVIWRELAGGGRHDQG